MDTMSLTAKYEDEMIAIRRHIHRHPELSNKEYKTTDFIREKLTEYGVEIAEIGMKTGVVAVIRGGKPGKTVAIREDIDALPMKELTGLPFASENDGACHSCGHDIHTTVLLYCAKVLSEIREELAGTVMLIFQPAEEHIYKPMINRKIRHCYLNEAIREETEDVKQENAKEEKK